MKRIILALALVAVLIASCGSQPTTPDRTIPFIGGNAGIDVGLVEGMPPAAVYDNQRMEFAMGISLHNVGEADVGTGTDNPFVRVSLDGFSPRAFGLTPDQMSKDLDQPLLGSHKNFDGTVLPGQLANMVFEHLMYQDPLQGNIVQNMVTRVCYDYENWATAPICYKDDIYENVEDICTLTGEKLPQNSGGPLHVISLVQNPLGPYKVMINFVIEHVGSGDFYGRTADEDCDSRVTNMNKYKVDVAVTSKDPGMTIDCSTLSGGNEGVITMFGGADTSVSCTLSTPSGGSRMFTDPVVINLKYRYGESITQPVIIQAVGNR